MGGDPFTAPIAMQHCGARVLFCSCDSFFSPIRRATDSHHKDLTPMSITWASFSQTGPEAIPRGAKLNQTTWEGGNDFPAVVFKKRLVTTSQTCRRAISRVGQQSVEQTTGGQWDGSEHYWGGDMAPIAGRSILICPLGVGTGSRRFLGQDHGGGHEGRWVGKPLRPLCRRP